MCSTFVVQYFHKEMEITKMFHGEVHTQSLNERKEVQCLLNPSMQRENFKKILNFQELYEKHN